MASRFVIMLRKYRCHIGLKDDWTPNPNSKLIKFLNHPQQNYEFNIEIH